MVRDAAAAAAAQLVYLLVRQVNAQLLQTVRCEIFVTEYV
jgi:hypothetical protein